MIDQKICRIFIIFSTFFPACHCFCSTLNFYCKFYFIIVKPGWLNAGPAHGKIGLRQNPSHQCLTMNPQVGVLVQVSLWWSPPQIKYRVRRKTAKPNAWLSESWSALATPDGTCRKVNNIISSSQPISLAFQQSCRGCGNCELLASSSETSYRLLFYLLSSIRISFSSSKGNIRPIRHQKCISREAVNQTFVKIDHRLFVYDVV